MNIRDWVIAFVVLIALLMFIAPGYAAECNGISEIWWALDGDATDECNPAYDGNAVGVAWVPGMFNQAGDFELGDAGDIVNVVDGAYELNTNRSVCVWVRPETLGVTQLIASKRSGGGDKTSNFEIMQRDTNIIWCGAGEGGTFDYAAATGAVQAGFWYHVCCVYDVSNTNTSIFINGSFNASDAGSEADQNNAASLFLGCFGEDNVCKVGTELYYDGVIDEFVYINRTLSPNEIYNLSQFNNFSGPGPGPPPAGTVGCSVTATAPAHNYHTNLGNSSQAFNVTLVCYGTPAMNATLLLNSTERGSNGTSLFLVNGTTILLYANTTITDG